MGTTGQVVKGWVPLTCWQVKVIGPLPSSEGCKYAITCVDTATRLLATYPTHHPSQKAVIVVLEHLYAAYGRPLIIESGFGVTVGLRPAD